MFLTRRMALASMLLPVMPRPSHAIKPAVPPGARPEPLTETIQARLQPGGAPVQVRAVAQEEPRRLVRVRAAGPGAPAGEVVLPSHYGGVGKLRKVSLRGRDIVLAPMDGEGGTGVSQRLVAMIAVDDDGRLRVIGLETLEGRESGTCRSEAAIALRLAPAGADGLRAAFTYNRVRGPCGQRGRDRPHREAWADVLAWDGRGAVTSPPAPAGAGPVRRATGEARANVARLLAAPMTDLSDIELGELGLFKVVSSELV